MTIHQWDSGISIQWGRTAHGLVNLGSSNSWGCQIQNANVALGCLAIQEWLSWDILVESGCGIPVVVQDMFPTTQHLKNQPHFESVYLSSELLTSHWDIFADTTVKMAMSSLTKIPLLVLHIQPLCPPDMKNESDHMCVRQMGVTSRLIERFVDSSECESLQGH